MMHPKQKASSSSVFVCVKCPFKGAIFCTHPSCVSAHMFPDETQTHTIPNAYKLGGVLISLTHEASPPGHQLTEAGLGSDGAQEVSHCPAAEPTAWLLQSLPPFFHISNPLHPLIPISPVATFPLVSSPLLFQRFSFFCSFFFFDIIIRYTAALCSSSITGHSNKETWSPLSGGSSSSVSRDQVSEPSSHTCTSTSNLNMQMFQGDLREPKLFQVGFKINH